MSFARNEKDVLEATVRSVLKNPKNVGFLTKDPDRFREWYPEINDVGSTRWMASKHGVEMNSYKNDIYKQAFMILNTLTREANI